MWPALKVERVNVRELRQVLDWAAAEGWNPGLGDAWAFHAADPQGFLVGFVSEEPVAAISLVRYGESFAFLGLYICRPEFRGRGYGRSMWLAAMTMAGTRTVGLDGVVVQQANYARSGFVYAHRNVRYAGEVNAQPRADTELVPIGHDLMLEIDDFDRAHFGFKRTRFLREWFAPGYWRSSLAAVDDGRVAGYGVIRDCREGAKIGPLFAETLPVARKLLSGLAAQRPGKTIQLDVPEPNGAAVALAEGLGMKPQFETARMYKGPPPALPLQRIFGITTFELG